MKISKNEKTNEVKSNKTCNKDYEEARKHIQSAIDCLGNIAASDQVARDSIVNLGVVALDLTPSK